MNIQQLDNWLKPKTLTAYEHGHQTGAAGRPIFDCPYSPTEHQYDYKDWMRGHADGMRDQKLGRLK